MQNSCRKKKLQILGVVAGHADATDRANDADSFAAETASCGGLSG